MPPDDRALDEPHAPRTPRTAEPPAPPPDWKPRPKGARVKVKVVHASRWTPEAVLILAGILTLGAGSMWVVSYLICETFICSTCGCSPP